MTLPAEPVRRGALFEKPGLFKNFESRPKILKVGDGERSEKFPPPSSYKNFDLNFYIPHLSIYST